MPAGSGRRSRRRATAGAQPRTPRAAGDGTRLVGAQRVLDGDDVGGRRDAVEVELARSSRCARARWRARPPCARPPRRSAASRASRATWRTSSRSIIGDTGHAPERALVAQRQQGRDASTPTRAAEPEPQPVAARRRSAGGEAAATRDAGRSRRAASTTVQTATASGSAGERWVSVATTSARPPSGASAARTAVALSAFQASARTPAISYHGRNSATASSSAASERQQLGRAQPGGIESTAESLPAPRRDPGARRRLSAC